MKNISLWFTLLLTNLTFTSSFAHSEIQPFDLSKVEHIDYASHRIESKSSLQNTPSKVGEIKTQWRLELKGRASDPVIGTNGKVYLGTSEGDYSGRIWVITSAQDAKQVRSVTYPTLKPVYYPIAVNATGWGYAVTNDFANDEPVVYSFNTELTIGKSVTFKSFIWDWDTGNLEVRDTVRTRLGPPVAREHGVVFQSLVGITNSHSITSITYLLPKFSWVNERGESNASTVMDYPMLMQNRLVSFPSAESPFHRLELKTISFQNEHTEQFSASFYGFAMRALDTCRTLHNTLVGSYHFTLPFLPFNWTSCDFTRSFNSPVSAPLVHPQSGMTYFGDAQSIARAVSSNGKLYFNILLGGDLSSAQPTLDQQNQIYFPSSNGYIYVLSSQGAIQKELACLIDGTLHPVSKKVVVKDHYVYATTTDGYLVIFDLDAPKGRELVAAQFYNASTAPAVSPEGVIYVGSADGYLYSLILQS